MLGFNVKRFVKPSLGSVITMCIPMCFFGLVHAQEVAFTPRFDSVENGEGESPESGSQVGLDNHLYSFGRFRAEIDLVCARLDEDKRAGRLVQIAEDSGRAKDLSPTYRALLKEITLRCGAIMRAQRGMGQNRSVVSPLFDVPYPSRWPSTETLDATSRLGAALYSYDKDSGTIFVALRRLSTLVLGYRGLTRGEIDYYGAFFKFLQSAWMGRKQTDRYQRLANKEESTVLFK